MPEPLPPLVKKLSWVSFAADASTEMPAGVRSDRIGRKRVYTAGLFVFAVVYAGFALTDAVLAVWPLLGIYGVYMAFTDGIGRALVVDLVDEDVRGRALGYTQAVAGACALVAGIGAGLLWDHVSHRAPFAFGAVCSLIAALIVGFAVRVPVNTQR